MKPIHMRSSRVSRPHSDRVLSRVDTALHLKKIMKHIVHTLNSTIVSSTNIFEYLLAPG